jgi:hypothetical protein
MRLFDNRCTHSHAAGDICFLCMQPRMMTVEATRSTKSVDVSRSTQNRNARDRNAAFTSRAGASNAPAATGGPPVRRSTSGDPTMGTTGRASVCGARPRASQSRESIDRLSRPKNVPAAPDYPYKGARRNSQSGARSSTTSPGPSSTVPNVRVTGGRSKDPFEKSSTPKMTPKAPRAQRSFDSPGKESSFANDGHDKPLPHPSPNAQGSFSSVAEITGPLGSIQEADHTSQRSSLSSVHDAQTPEPLDGSPSGSAETARHTQVSP